MSLLWGGNNANVATAASKARRDGLVLEQRARQASGMAPYRAGEHIAKQLDMARADGARSERERSQGALAGVMCVAAVEAVIIFALVVWR